MSNIVKGIGRSANGLFVGTSEVEAMYLGSTKVYESRIYDAEIEYLQGNGAQYINCDIHPTTTSVVVWKAKASYTSSSGRMFMVGDGDVNLSHYCEFRDNKFGCYGNYMQNILSNSTVYDVEFEIRGTTKAIYKITIGGTQYTKEVTQYQGRVSNNIFLFAINASYIAASGLRLGANELYVDGVLVRDYKPVRVGQVGYMFDSLEGKLFGNAGSGGFTLGPDV